MKQQLHDVCVVIECIIRDAKGIFEKNYNVVKMEHHLYHSECQVLQCKDKDFWAEKIIVFLNIQILMIILKVVQIQEYDI